MFRVYIDLYSQILTLIPMAKKSKSALITIPYCTYKKLDSNDIAVQNDHDFIYTVITTTPKP